LDCNPKLAANNRKYNQNKRDRRDKAEVLDCPQSCDGILQLFANCRHAALHITQKFRRIVAN
jgi:hypothetical protein